MEDGLDKFAGLDKDLSNEDSNRFKRVFLDDDGQFVLCMILDMCKFMENCDNEQDMGRNNFAKELMTIIYTDRGRKYLNPHRIIKFIKNKLTRRKK